MSEKIISIPYTEIEDLTKLNDDEQLLVNTAIDAAKQAYSPYSKFNVGAAVLLENDNIVIGSNQENAAYPSGLCAERVALFSAGAQQGKIAPRKMAIAAIKDGKLTDNPVSPCGACRQVFAEVEKRYSKSFSLLLIGKDKIVKFEKSGLLLPFTFNSIDI